MIDEYDDGSIASAIDRCGGSKVRMNINSMGGSVNLGQEVIAAMQAYKNAGGIIETVNRGIAYSTAGWIFAAGSKGYRKMMPFASLMTHPPAFADGKTISDFQKGSEKWNILTDAMDMLIDIFAPITGRTKNVIKKFMLEDTVFSAKKAVKEGFADEIVKISNSIVLKNDLQPEEIMNAVESIEYEVINENNQPKPGNNNNKRMKKVAELLNLNPDASEDSVLQAVKDLQNRAVTAEADKTSADTKLEQVEAERDSLKNELSTVKDAEVLNYVKKYIGDNKDRKKQEESLLNFAKSDFETFKSVCPIDEIVNKGEEIDKEISPEGDKKTDEEIGIENARKFFNMSLAEKDKLKKENIGEYNGLVNAYDKYYKKLV